MLPPSPPASGAAPNRSSRRQTGSRRLVSRLLMVAEMEGSRRGERSRHEVGPLGAEAVVRRAGGEGAEPVPQRAAASYPSNGVRWIPRSTPGWTSAASLPAPGQLRPKRQQGRPALRHRWAQGRRCRRTRRRQLMVPSRWYAPLRWPRAVPKVTPRRSEGWWRPHWRSRRWPLWCARPSSSRPCSWRPRPWRPRPWRPRRWRPLCGPWSWYGAAVWRAVGQPPLRVHVAPRSSHTRRCRWAYRCRRQTASTRRRTDSARWRSPHGRTCRSSLPIRNAELGTMAERLATSELASGSARTRDHADPSSKWPSSVATSFVAPMTWLTSSSVSWGCTGSDRMCDVSRSDTGR